MRKDSWTYRGNLVNLSPTANIPRGYHPGEEYSYWVQQVIHQVRPWEPGDRSFSTDRVPPILHLLVVEIRKRPLIWGIHKGHKVENPQLSPFVKTYPIYTTLLTVEMAGTPQDPLLTDVYPGTLVPPLPWQGSSGNYPGGMEACVRFWSTHAYDLPHLIVRGTKTTVPPDWFLGE